MKALYLIEVIGFDGVILCHRTTRDPGYIHELISKYISKPGVRTIKTTKL